MADSEELPSNEIVVAAKDAAARRDGAKAKPEANRWPIATVAGIGIGSAALAAALIYANRGGKKKP